MEPSAIAGLIGSSPVLGIAAFAIWALIKKDAQCTTLMQQMADLAKQQAVAASEVKASLDGIRDAIRVGTRSA